MPRLYNVSAQFLQPDPLLPSVPPGEGFDFTADQAKSAGCEWSKEDPRAGLEAEKAFKAKRDSKPEASPAPENTESGDPKET
jgi:hypothetical protein